MTEPAERPDPAVLAARLQQAFEAEQAPGTPRQVRPGLDGPATAERPGQTVAGGRVGDDPRPGQGRLSPSAELRRLLEQVSTRLDDDATVARLAAVEARLAEVGALEDRIGELTRSVASLEAQVGALTTTIDSLGSHLGSFTSPRPTPARRRFGGLLGPS